VEAHCCFRHSISQCPAPLRLEDKEPLLFWSPRAHPKRVSLGEPYCPGKCRRHCKIRAFGGRCFSKETHRRSRGALNGPYILGLYRFMSSRTTYEKAVFQAGPWGYSETSPWYRAIAAAEAPKKIDTVLGATEFFWRSAFDYLTARPRNNPHSCQRASQSFPGTRSGRHESAIAAVFTQIAPAAKVTSKH